MGPKAEDDETIEGSMFQIYLFLALPPSKRSKNSLLVQIDQLSEPNDANS